MKMISDLKCYLFNELGNIVEDLNAVMALDDITIDSKKQMAAVFGARWDEANKILKEIERLEAEDGQKNSDHHIHR